MGAPAKKRVEDMLIILPLPCLFICGMTAFIQSYTPFTFTAITRSHS